MTDSFEAYRDYFWDNGVPVGRGTIDGTAAAVAYKIVKDPYRKRYSIERYQQGVYEDIVYDSALFDFRWLKPADQVGWSKETVSTTEEEVVCLLRTIEDRVILKEVYRFEKGVCVECHAFSPHEVPVSVQRIYFSNRGDPFNGVILFDTHGHPITFKRYAVDAEGEFTEVIEECWTMQSARLPI